MVGTERYLAMAYKNNNKFLGKQAIDKEKPHYALRKLSVGVASVLLGTTLYIWGVP
jgi:hypothetical protein